MAAIPWWAGDWVVAVATAYQGGLNMIMGRSRGGRG